MLIKHDSSIRVLYSFDFLGIKSLERQWRRILFNILCFHRPAMGQTDEKLPSEPVEPKTADPTKDNVDDLITSVQLGIWQVLTLKSSPFNLKQWRDDIFTGSSQFYRLLGDMYRLSPGMMVLFMLSKTWGGVEAAVLMHLSSRLLQIVRNYLNR